MSETLLYLTYLGVIFFIGLLCSLISKKLRIPNFLLLILFGIFLGNVSYNGSLISFPPIFLTTIAIFALAIIVFDASSRLKLREFDAVSISGIKLTLIFLILNSIGLSIAVYYLYESLNPLLAIIFGVMMSGTAPSVVLATLKQTKSKVFQLLEVESIINTPLIVLIPFLLIGIIEKAGTISLSDIITQIAPFAQQFITGIGAGVLIGIIIFKFMRKKYSPTLSPLAIITAALLTYVISEQLGGNGVLAVTTAGLFFGNIYVKHKRKLQEFSETFSTFLEILVFILIGLIIKIPLTSEFFITSFYIFLIYIFIRFISVNLSFIHSTYTFKERLFMTLNAPKGIAVAVIAFTLATKIIVGIKPLLDLILIFMIYSIILSTIVTHFSKFFVKVEAIQKETFRE